MTVEGEEVVGRYRPEDENEVAPLPHSQRFDVAFDRALDEAARQWGPGEYGKVAVRYEVAVVVRNPGSVGEYRCTMTR